MHIAVIRPALIVEGDRDNTDYSKGTKDIVLLRNNSTPQIIQEIMPNVPSLDMFIFQ